MNNASIWKKYSYVWLTLVFFLFSLTAHWIFGWFAFVDEQQSHNQTVEFSKYLIEMFRDTFENWQSEFLQLIWQVAGLAYLFYIGSPQSKEGDERKEAKLDLIIRAVAKNGDEEIKKLDKKYLRQ
jgi:hypothetical protein